MIVDTHLHVWSSDYETYPMDGGRTSSEDGSVEFLNTRMDRGRRRQGRHRSAHPLPVRQYLRERHPEALSRQVRRHRTRQSVRARSRRQVWRPS